MKLAIFKTLLTGALCALVAMPVMAQEDELKGLAGYIDFGDLSATYGDPKISINIGGTLLQFVGAMAEESDSEASQIMSQLKGVRVFGYPITNDPTVAKEKFGEVKSTLRTKGWEPVVQVNEDDEQVLIYMKMDGQSMEGMTVMTVDEEEVMFINIIGKLDPKELGRIMDNFDIDIDDAIEVD
jgi:hypothetical protein